MDLIMEHLAATIAAGAAALLVWLRAWAVDLYRRRILETALGRAVGLAMANPAVRAGAAAAMDDAARIGADYLRRTIPDTLRKLGVQGALVDMVRGELGKHLPPPPAPVPGPDPEAVRVPRTPVLFEGEYGDGR